MVLAVQPLREVPVFLLQSPDLQKSCPEARGSRPPHSPRAANARRGEAEYGISPGSERLRAEGSAAAVRLDGGSEPTGPTASLAGNWAISAVTRASRRDKNPGWSGRLGPPLHGPHEGSQP